jgi:hypothetical protein
MIPKDHPLAISNVAWFMARTGPKALVSAATRIIAGEVGLAITFQLTYGADVKRPLAPPSFGRPDI